MKNTNLNDIAVDIIGAVTIWNLTHMFYNVAQVEHGPLYKRSPAYLVYIGLGCLATFTTANSLYKYY